MLDKNVFNPEGFEIIRDAFCPSSRLNSYVELPNKFHSSMEYSAPMICDERIIHVVVAPMVQRIRFAFYPKSIIPYEDLLKVLQEIVFKSASFSIYQNRNPEAYKLNAIYRSDYVFGRNDLTVPSLVSPFSDKSGIIAKRALYCFGKLGLGTSNWEDKLGFTLTAHDKIEFGKHMKELKDDYTERYSCSVPEYRGILPRGKVSEIRPERLW